MTETNTLQTKHLIIGFGKAGKTLAATLAKQGEKVTLIEKDPAMIGGTCINIGCIPTKTLLEAAKENKTYEKAYEYKNQVTNFLRDKNKENIENAGVQLIIGKASFIDKNTLLVNHPDNTQTKITAENIYINTGAAPFVPPIKGLKENMQAGKKIYTSTEIMQQSEMPKELTIIGAGFIGIEFATMAAQFGSKVTMLEGAPAFLANEDEDTASEIKAQLEKLGVEIKTNIKIQEVHFENEKLCIHINEENKDIHIKTDAILVSTGRAPATKDLNLQAAGVNTNERGFIIVDDKLKTSQENIWAMGDVNGSPQFTFISLDDYRIVLNQLKGGEYNSTKMRGHWANCTFTNPPIAQIGLNEKKAKAQNIDYALAKMPVAAIPKARTLNKTQGFIKALVNKKTGEIIGATFICADAHEIINTVQIAMNAKLNYTHLRDAIYTHPSMTEAFNDLFAQIKI